MSSYHGNELWVASKSCHILRYSDPILQQEMYLKEYKNFANVSNRHWNPNTTGRCSFTSLNIKHILWFLLRLAASFKAFTIYGTIGGIDVSTITCREVGFLNIYDEIIYYFGFKSCRRKPCNSWDESQTFRKWIKNAESQCGKVLFHLWTFTAISCFSCPSWYVLLLTLTISVTTPTKIFSDDLTC